MTGGEFVKFLRAFIGGHLDVGLAGQARYDRFDQFIRGEGFDEVIIGAANHAAAETIQADHASHENKGDWRGIQRLADGAEGFVTIHVRHVDVADDKVGLMRVNHLDTHLAAGGFLNRETVVGQDNLDEFADVFFVVYD